MVFSFLPSGLCLYHDMAILQATGLQFAISPYHDKDINQTGEKKKPHWHVLICFNGPSTYKNANKISESVNGTICQPVKSTIGIIRYFSHKDNPEKAQYNEEDIQTINGLDIKEIDGLTTTKIEIIKRQLIDIIRNNQFVEYAELIDYLKDNKLNDYLTVASRNTIYINAYISSKRYSKEEKKLLNKDNKYDIT